MPGSRLRRARERASLSQAELAERAGLSRQLIASAEAGRHAPAVDAALRIARVLGEPVEALFGEAPGAARSVLGDAPGRGRARGRRPGRRRAGRGPAGLARRRRRVVGHARRRRRGRRRAPAARRACGGPGRGRLRPRARPLRPAAGPRRRAPAWSRSRARPGARSRRSATGAPTRRSSTGPRTRMPAPPVPVRRLHLARWRVGDRDRPDPAGALARRGARRPGAAGAARGVGDEPAGATCGRPAGPPPPAAALARRPRRRGAPRGARRAAAAVTFEPAARQHGLAFLPLETHARRALARRALARPPRRGGPRGPARLGRVPRAGGARRRLRPGGLRLSRTRGVSAAIPAHPERSTGG